METSGEAFLSLVVCNCKAWQAYPSNFSHYPSITFPCMATVFSPACPYNLRIRGISIWQDNKPRMSLCSVSGVVCSCSQCSTIATSLVTSWLPRQPFRYRYIVRLLMNALLPQANYLHARCLVLNPSFPVSAGLCVHHVAYVRRGCRKETLGTFSTPLKRVRKATLA